MNLFAEHCCYINDRLFNLLTQSARHKSFDVSVDFGATYLFFFLFCTKKQLSKFNHNYTNIAESDRPYDSCDIEKKLN